MRAVAARLVWSVLLSLGGAPLCQGCILTRHQHTCMCAAPTHAHVPMEPSRRHLSLLLLFGSSPVPVSGMMRRITRRASATSAIAAGTAAVNAARIAKTAAEGAAGTAAGSAARIAAKTGSGPGGWCTMVIKPASTEAVTGGWRHSLRRALGLIPKMLGKVNKAHACWLSASCC